MLLVFFYSNLLQAQVNVSVQINGVSAEVESNIRLFLSLEQQKDHPLLNEGRLRRLHKSAPREISNALQPFGYYRPTISAELNQASDNHWQAIYDIDPGPPLRIAKFDFISSDSIKNDAEFQALIQDFPLHQGDIFDHVKYENIKSSLVKLAAELGYFDAHFVEHSVEIDLDAYEARINLHYDAGIHYLFGDVRLEQDVLDPGLLSRYVPFERGDPYNLNLLIDLQQALNNSDYFSSVEVSPDLAQAGTDDIPIDVKLAPRKRHRYTFGLGYGTDTGARTKFGWEIPRLNREGHRINTEAKVSEIGYSLGVQYRVPVFNPRTDQLVYSAGVVNEETDTSESTVQTVGIALNRSFEKWRQSIALNYQQEKFIVADDEGDSTLLIPSINWSRTWGSNFIYTIDGLRFDLGLRGASDKVISDTNFFQAQGGIKAISSIGSRDRLIARGQLGSTWTDTFHELPSSVRFFAGGSQSVRGYSYQSLGPVDASGKVVGGRHLMVGSIEYEHSFENKWGVAVFYDGGNAIDDMHDDLERGAGFGLRWQTPIGPVRIDLASAISREGQPWRLHITIGPDL